MKTRRALPLDDSWAIAPAWEARVDELLSLDASVVDRLEACGDAMEQADAGAVAYQVREDVATFDLAGPMSRRPTLMGLFFGEIVTPAVADALLAAKADGAVREIFVKLDSPGGVVAGTPEMAAVVEEVNRVKPITVWSDGTIASAALWGFAAAKRIYLSPSAGAGSVGIISVVTDSSEAAAKDGLKRHVVRSGPLKGGAVPGAPVPKAYLADVERQVNAIADTFAGYLAKHRRLTPAQLERVRDGGMYTAAEAQELGLVDGVMSLSAVMSRLTRNSNPSPGYGASDHKEQHVKPNTLKLLGLADGASEDDIEKAVKALAEKPAEKPAPKAKDVEPDVEAIAARVADIVAAKAPNLDALIEAQVTKRLEAADRDRKITAQVEAAISGTGVIPVGARAEAMAVAGKDPEAFAALVAKLPQVTPLKRRFSPAPADASVGAAAVLTDDSINTPEGREALAEQAQALMAKDPKLTFDAAVDKVLATSGVN